MSSKSQILKGYAGVPLAEAVRCKQEGREFDSRWGHWVFFNDNLSGRIQPLTEKSARVSSGADNLAILYADCRDITVACPGLYMKCFTLQICLHLNFVVRVDTVRAWQIYWDMRMWDLTW